MHNPMLKRMLLGLSQRQADCIVRAVVLIQQQETAARRDRVLAFLALQNLAWSAVGGWKKVLQLWTCGVKSSVST